MKTAARAAQSFLPAFFHLKHTSFFRSKYWTNTRIWNHTCCFCFHFCVLIRLWNIVGVVWAKHNEPISLDESSMHFSSEVIRHAREGRHLSVEGPWSQRVMNSTSECLTSLSVAHNQLWEPNHELVNKVGVEVQAYTPTWKYSNNVPLPLRRNKSPFIGWSPLYKDIRSLLNIGCLLDIGSLIDWYRVLDWYSHRLLDCIMNIA